MAQKFDIIIVGGGPGGYTAAIRAAQLGKKTALVEKDKLGGLCLNWGCIPSKALIRSAEVFHLLKDAPKFGFAVDTVNVKFDKIIKRSRQIATKLNKGVGYLMKKNGVTVFSGSADLSQNGFVQVEKPDGSSENLQADHIIIATGGNHRTIPGIEVDHERVINSSDAMVLKEIPKSMVIIGGGPIGVEFAYIYASLGTEVTIVEMLPKILPLEDDEIIKVLTKEFKGLGIKIHTDAKVASVKKNKSGVSVEIETGDGSTNLEADLALMAVGFSGNTEGLGLETLMLETERSFIKTDEYCQTNIFGYYAIGDVIGPPLLAHVASAEGIVAVEHLAGLNPAPVDYGNIPGCTYCNPQVASVGMTEQQAKDAGYEIKVGRFPYQAIGKAIAVGETTGLVKLIFDAKYGELLGGHIVGAEATDLIGELVMARALETTGHAIMKTVHAHPTLSEAIMEAAADAYGEAINF